MFDETNCAPASLALDFGAAASRTESLVKRLLSYESAVETFLLPNPESPGPWKDEAEFYESLLRVETPVRYYKVEGQSFKIIVKESYALLLDEVRKLKEDSRSTCQTEKETALAALAENELANRALPEDVLLYVSELPDAGYLSNVYLLNDANVADLWVRQIRKDYNPDFISSAAAKPNGDLLLFKRDIEDYLRTDIYHEWCHWLDHRCPDLEALFRKAILLEQRHKDWYVPSRYALTSFAEHWAVFGERMLACDQSVFQEAAKKAPLRTLVWMRALAASLAKAPVACTRKDELLKRCTEARSLALGPAQEYLRSLLPELSSAGAEERGLAESLASVAELAFSFEPKHAGPAL